MDKDAALEIYKQRYEVWRHFDKLRWQLVQLLVAIFSASALVVRATEGAIEWWFTLALSVQANWTHMAKPSQSDAQILFPPTAYSLIAPRA
jgi:hypothetical protein